VAGSTLRIAVRNLGRSPKRTALTLTAIAVAQVGLLSMDGLVNGYVDGIVSAITGPMIGDVQVHHPMWREERALEQTVGGISAALEAIRATPGVEQASARIYAPSLTAAKEDAHIALVVGVDPELEATGVGLLATVPKAELPTEGRVLVGRKLADKMGIGAGAELALIGQAADGSIANDLYIVSGLLHTTVDEVNRSGVVMTTADAQALFALHDQAHEIVVKGSNVVTPEQLSRALGALPLLGGTEILAWRALVPDLAKIIELSKMSSYIILVLVFVAAAAGIANTMLMATFERTRELGMLLALGCEPLRIVRMLTVEAVMLGALGVALGSVIGWALVAVTAHTGLDMSALAGGEMDFAFQGLVLPMKVTPRLECFDVAIGVAAVLFTSLLAAVWPAIHAARLQPMEAMRA